MILLVYFFLRSLKYFKRDWYWIDRLLWLIWWAQNIPNNNFLWCQKRNPNWRLRCIFSKLEDRVSIELTSINYKGCRHLASLACAEKIVLHEHEGVHVLKLGLLIFVRKLFPPGLISCFFGIIGIGVLFGPCCGGDFGSGRNLGYGKVPAEAAPEWIFLDFVLNCDSVLGAILFKEGGDFLVYLGIHSDDVSLSYLSLSHGLWHNDHRL